MQKLSAPSPLPHRPYLRSNVAKTSKEVNACHELVSNSSPAPRFLKQHYPCALRRCHSDTISNTGNLSKASGPGDLPILIQQVDMQDRIHCTGCHSVEGHPFGLASLCPRYLLQTSRVPSEHDVFG